MLNMNPKILARICGQMKIQFIMLSMLINNRGSGVLIDSHTTEMASFQATSSIQVKQTYQAIMSGWYNRSHRTSGGQNYTSLIRRGAGTTMALVSSKQSAKYHRISMKLIINLQDDEEYYMVLVSEEDEITELLNTKIRQ